MTEDKFKEINDVWENNMLEKRFVCLKMLSKHHYSTPEIIYKNVVFSKSSKGQIVIKPFVYLWHFRYDAKNNPIIEIFINTRKYTFNYGTATIEVLETFDNKEYIKYMFSNEIVKSEGIRYGKKINDEFTTTNVGKYMLVE